MASVIPGFDFPTTATESLVKLPGVAGQLIAGEAENRVCLVIGTTSPTMWVSTLSDPVGPSGFPLGAGSGGVLVICGQAARMAWFDNSGTLFINILEVFREAPHMRTTPDQVQLSIEQLIDLKDRLCPK